MEDRCHRERIRKHPKKLKPRISRKLIAIWLSAATVSGLLLILIAQFVIPVVSSILYILGVFAILSTLVPVIMRYLSKPQHADGATCLSHQCRICKSSDPENGCAFFCDHCDGEWGAAKGCVLIRHPDLNAARKMGQYSVHIKEHNLQEVDKLPKGHASRAAYYWRMIYEKMEALK